MIHNSHMDDQTPSVAFNDTDLVYVDIENRVVVSLVQFDSNGNPKPLQMSSRVAEEEEEKGPPAKGRRLERRERKRFYPWGTYKSMKHVYRLEGKQKKTDPVHTLDDVIEKALKEPYWD